MKVKEGVVMKNKLKNLMSIEDGVLYAIISKQSTGNSYVVVLDGNLAVFENIYVAKEAFKKYKKYITNIFKINNYKMPHCKYLIAKYKMEEMK